MLRGHVVRRNRPVTHKPAYEPEWKSEFEKRLPEALPLIFTSRVAQDARLEDVPATPGRIADWIICRVFSENAEHARSHVIHFEDRWMRFSPDTLQWGRLSESDIANIVFHILRRAGLPRGREFVDAVVYELRQALHFPIIEPAFMWMQ